MPVNTPRDLLRQLLGGIYQGEQERLPLLDAMETETHSRLLRDRLRRGREEARQHTGTIERCFELIGSEPPRATCAAVRAIAEERRAFERDRAAPAVLEAYHIDVALRLTHLMLAAYRSAAALGREAGQGDVARLLEACVAHERDTAEWLESSRAEVLAEARPPSAERAVPAVAG